MQSPPDAFGLEDSIEGARVLRVSVPEPEPSPTEPAVDREVAGLLGDPSRVRMGRGPGDVDSPGGELEEEQHVERLQRDGSSLWICLCVAGPA